MSWTELRWPQTHGMRGLAVKSSRKVVIGHLSTPRLCARHRCPKIWRLKTHLRMDLSQSKCKGSFQPSRSVDELSIAEDRPWSFVKHKPARRRGRRQPPFVSNRLRSQFPKPEITEADGTMGGDPSGRRPRLAVP